MGSYEEVTAPLRKLLKKDAEFKWTNMEEEAYVKLMEIISDPATLVVDASEMGSSRPYQSCIDRY